MADFESSNDIDGMFETEDFAVDAAITGGSTIQAIFDNAFQVENVATGQVVSTNPQIIVQNSDLGAITIGTIITILSVAYNVIEIHPNIDNTTTLMLSRD